MKLKLAQYNSEAKFERFLELGKDFRYCGDMVMTFFHIDKMTPKRQLGFNGQYTKDEKDPLNRFDGWFDGRTYGEGRFILINGLQTSERFFMTDAL